jgi:hypothetical protein
MRQPGPEVPTFLAGISELAAHAQTKVDWQRVSTYGYDNNGKGKLSVKGYLARLARGADGKLLQPARRILAIQLGLLAAGSASVEQAQALELSLQPAIQCKGAGRPAPKMKQTVHAESVGAPATDLDLNGDGWCDWIIPVPYPTNTQLPEYMASEAVLRGDAKGARTFGEMARLKSHCRPIVPQKNEGIHLSQAGTYCLKADLKIDDRNWFFPDGPSGRPYEAVDIDGDNITFDLQEHAIRTGDVSLGIRIENAGSTTYEPGQQPRQPRQVVIRNGKLKTTASVGIRSGYYELSVLSDMGHPLETVQTTGMSKDALAKESIFRQRLREEIFHNQLALRPLRAADYQQRGVRIENMHINARYSKKVSSSARAGAINIQGAGTVIRNCVIETDGSTALWLFGPNAVIENNTIIVHGASPVREADAPIRLHHGDGAIVRNNRIVIKDGANRRGLSVFDTGAITVEKNTFYGMTEKDEVARAFTGNLDMNESGSRFQPAWKAVFVGR